MSEKLPSLTSKKLIRVLAKAGFVFTVLQVVDQHRQEAGPPMAENKVSAIAILTTLHRILRRNRYTDGSAVEDNCRSMGLIVLSEGCFASLSHRGGARTLSLPQWRLYGNR